MRTILITLMVWACYASLQAQEITDKSTITFDVSKIDLLRLHNLYGPVQVEAVDQGPATIVVKRHLRAKTSKLLEAGKSKVYLDSTSRDGILVFYVEAPGREVRFREDGRVEYRTQDGFWWDEEKNSGIKFKFDIVMKVPAQTNLYVSTHEKDLKVSGMKGKLVARNHHNDIYLKNIGGSASVHTHHGDISLSYSKNPTEDGDYHSHHGDIKVYYQSSLSADVSLDSHHGEFFTDFDWQPKPIEVATNASNRGTKYYIGKGTQVRIGNGGVRQDFKTHHGDIYLLDQKKH